eukprot:3210191-Rhodomonas_salina.2
MLRAVPVQNARIASLLRGAVLDHGLGLQRCLKSCCRRLLKTHAERAWFKFWLDHNPVVAGLWGGPGPGIACARASGVRADPRVVERVAGGEALQRVHLKQPAHQVASRR